MDDDLRRSLVAIAGNRAIDEAGTIHPANLEQVREVALVCRQHGLSLDTREAGGLRVSADRLDKVRCDAGALILHVGAAATWTAVRQAAATDGLVIGGLPGVRSEAVGESVASGEVSHRTVVGVTLLTHAGEVVSAGGRTLKDVVGYDVAGLALGSGDRLGLILAVALRLEPREAQTPAVAGPGPWRGDAGIDVAAAFRR